jgi:hypothetical protein
MARQESRRTAELKVWRAELVEQLDRVDFYFRFHNIGSALAEMARYVERTMRRLGE